MGVRERLLAIKLINKERKNKDFFKDLEVEVIQSGCNYAKENSEKKVVRKEINNG